jgi:hypothetical protein
VSTLGVSQASRCRFSIACVLSVFSSDILVTRHASITQIAHTRRALHPRDFTRLWLRSALVKRNFEDDPYGRSRIHHLAAAINHLSARGDAHRPFHTVIRVWTPTILDSQYPPFELTGKHKRSDAPTVNELHPRELERVLQFMLDLTTNIARL